MKYAEFRTIKALTLKASLDKRKVIELSHYKQPIGYLVSKSEYEKLKQKSGD